MKAFWDTASRSLPLSWQTFQRLSFLHQQHDHRSLYSINPGNVLLGSAQECPPVSFCWWKQRNSFGTDQCMNPRRRMRCTSLYFHCSVSAVRADWVIRTQAGRWEGTQSQNTGTVHEFHFHQPMSSFPRKVRRPRQHDVQVVSVFFIVINANCQVA
jgi:hypothetical protein